MKVATTTRRGFMLLAGGLALGPGMRAMACNNPPKHYAKPCKATSYQYTAYFAIGQERGIFSERKLDLDFEGVDDAELIGRIVQDEIVECTGSQAVRAHLAGAPARIFSIPLPALRFQVWAQNQFAGESIGMLNVGSGRITAAKAFLGTVNKTIDQVHILQHPSADDLVQSALGSPGTAILLPAYQSNAAVRANLKSLGEVSPPYAYEVFVAPDPILADNLNLQFLVEFLAAIQDVITFMQQDKTAAIAILQQRLSIKEDVAAEIYEIYAESAAKPSLPQPALQAVLDEMAYFEPDKAERIRGLNLADLTTTAIVNASR